MTFVGKDLIQGKSPHSNSRPTCALGCHINSLTQQHFFEIYFPIVMIPFHVSACIVVVVVVVPIPLTLW